MHLVRACVAASTDESCSVPGEGEGEERMRGGDVDIRRYRAHFMTVETGGEIGHCRGW